MDNTYNLSGYLNYKKGDLCVNEINYNKLLEGRQTPLVCISLDRIKDNIDLLKKELDSMNIKYNIHYAVKASYFKPLLFVMKKNKIGVEVISKNELKMVRLLGFSGKEIIFNGLGRDGLEIFEALRKGNIVNINSISELKKIKALNKSVKGMKVGLRVHPNFKGDGNFVKKEGKLGMSYEEAVEAVNYSAKIGLTISGFSYHVFSSQTCSLNYCRPLKELTTFINNIKINRDSIKLEYIDIGGGMASRMLFEGDDKLREFIKQVVITFKKNYSDDISLLLEPGRHLVSDAMVVLSRVKEVKKNRIGTWAILDIGTNYLIPAPGADFKVITCKKNKFKELKYTMFVDGICSPSGFIGKAIVNTKEGEIVAITNCGAYTSVMKEEFIFSSPEHIFISKMKIINRIKAMSFTDFLKYHGW